MLIVPTCFMLLAIILLAISDALAVAGALDELENCKKNAAHCHGDEAPRSLIEIEENTWSRLLVGEWLVSICAKNRDDCKKLELNGYKLAASCVHTSLNVGIALVDLTKDSTLLRRLSALSLPTVYHVKDGEFRRLDPNMDVQALRQLVENQEWLSLDPVPFWQHPTSFWACLSVFAYNAVHDLWKSGVVGDDYNMAKWGVNIMFTGAVTMVIWIFIFFWRVVTVVIYYLTRAKDPAAQASHRKGRKADLVNGK